MIKTNQLNPFFVIHKDKSEDPIGVGGLVTATFNVTVRELGEQEHTSEDEADLEVRRARENEPTRPMEDVFRDLGLDE